MTATARALMVLGLLALMGCAPQTLETSRTVTPSEEALANSLMAEEHLSKFSFTGLEENGGAPTDKGNGAEMFSLDTAQPTEFVPACMKSFEKAKIPQEFCQCLENSTKNKLTDRQNEMLIAILNYDRSHVARLTQEIGVEQRQVARQLLVKSSHQCGKES